MQQTDNVGISGRIRYLRSIKGEREVDISTVLEISPAHYCHLEQGKTKITVDVLHKACIYYDVTAEYILFGIKRKKWNILGKLDGFPEVVIRRLLKILSCLLFMEINETEVKDSAMYKILMGGLMEMTPVDADSAIPSVLEYEKNRRNVSENTMIKELGLSRFVWTSIMKNEPIKNIEIPLRIQSQYGYGLDFLINNKIKDNMFLESQLSKETFKRQQEILHTFEQIIKMQSKDI